VRRGHELAEAAAGKRGNFGERFALDQARRELARDCDRNLDRFAFKPRFDRFQCAGGLIDAGRDAFERGCDPSAVLGLCVVLTFLIAALAGGRFRLGKLRRVVGKRDRRLALAAGGEIDIEQEFCCLPRARSEIAFPSAGRSC